MQSIEANLLITDQIDVQTQMSVDLNLAKKDMIDGLTKYRLWTYLGIIEMRRRYKRTIIGPFWTTLSLGIFIGCMGFMLSLLWKYELKTFLPYFCSGYIAWIFIQTVIMEGCCTFTSSSTFIRQICLPYTLYACLLTWRNLIIMLHHIAIWALVMLYTQTPLNFNTLLIFPAMALVFLTCVWVSILLGIICTRFRDVQQIITSLLQLAMFVTPIMWTVEHIGPRGAFLVNFNPMYHFINLIRMPLIGEAPSLVNWVAALGISVVGGGLTYLLFAKNYRKIVFWL
jgi:lipopolysaccharide transport system permease protein